MTESAELSPLLEPLETLVQVLDKFSERSIIIGGIAVSIIGKPRLTADIDVLVLLPVDKLNEFISIAEAQGINPRISEAVDFAKNSRMLLLKHEKSGTNIDISMGILPFEQEAVERAVIHRIGNLTLNLPTPEDLIILKAVAHRPKDLSDIQGIILNHPELDVPRIENWIKQFADFLEKPELWEDIASGFGE